MTNTTVHTAAEIESMLSLGLSPITDNVQALAELGFERSFPQAKRGGYEASVYERFVEHGNRRNKAQRAFLRVD